MADGNSRVNRSREEALNREARKGAIMFMQLHYWGLSRTALLLSAVGAVVLAMIGSAAGPV
jgi:hypothetical protein